MKICWFEDYEHQDITEQLQEFLKQSLPYCLLGVLALQQLIIEMSYATKGRTLIQTRRISISFRDKSLLDIFKITM